jgi:hypothetical protein
MKERLQAQALMELIPEGSHEIEAMWREADIVALNERVRAITDWLEHTEDLAEMLAEDKKVTSNLRCTLGLLRSLKNDFADRAEERQVQIDARKGDSG